MFKAALGVLILAVVLSAKAEDERVSGNLNVGIPSVGQFQASGSVPNFPPIRGNAQVSSSAGVGGKFGLPDVSGILKNPAKTIQDTLTKIPGLGGSGQVATNGKVQGNAGAKGVSGNASGAFNVPGLDTVNHLLQNPSKAVQDTLTKIPGFGGNGQVSTNGKVQGNAGANGVSGSGSGAFNVPGLDTVNHFLQNPSKTFQETLTKIPGFGGSGQVSANGQVQGNAGANGVSGSSSGAFDTVTHFLQNPLKTAKDTINKIPGVGKVQETVTTIVKNPLKGLGDTVKKIPGLGGIGGYLFPGATGNVQGGLGPNGVPYLGDIVAPVKRFGSTLEQNNLGLSNGQLCVCPPGVQNVRWPAMMPIGIRQ